MGGIKRRRFNSPPEGYKVGYARPPKHSQFKPGECGNNRGRPKGARNFKTIFRATLKAPVKVTRNGKAQKISTLQALLLRLVEKGLAGDLRAINQLVPLMQLYCGEELAVSIGLSAADADVLRIYQQRLLSGAASGPEETPNDGEKGKNEE